MIPPVALAFYGTAHLLLLIAVAVSFLKPSPKLIRKLWIAGVIIAMAAPLVGVVGAAKAASDADRRVRMAGPAERQKALSDAASSSIRWTAAGMISMPTLLLLSGVLVWRDFSLRKRGAAGA
jgi:hypothetical protein